jgi:hypothetical protein
MVGTQVSAVAAVQFNQSRHITMGNARFFPRLEG